MNDHDLNVQLIKMPCKIKATVTVNDDDSYTIFLNKNISAEQQRAAALHELRHIARGDLFSEDSVEGIENRIREN